MPPPRGGGIISSPANTLKISAAATYVAVFYSYGFYRLSRGDVREVFNIRHRFRPAKTVENLGITLPYVCTTVFMFRRPV